MRSCRARVTGPPAVVDRRVRIKQVKSAYKYIISISIIRKALLTADEKS